MYMYVYSYVIPVPLYMCVMLNLSVCVDLVALSLDQWKEKEFKPIELWVIWIVISEKKRCNFQNLNWIFKKVILNCALFMTDKVVIILNILCHTTGSTGNNNPNHILGYAYRVMRMIDRRQEMIYFVSFLCGWCFSSDELFRTWLMFLIPESSDSISVLRFEVSGIRNSGITQLKVAKHWKIIPLDE